MIWKILYIENIFQQNEWFLVEDKEERKKKKKGVIVTKEVSSYLWYYNLSCC